MVSVSVLQFGRAIVRDPKVFLMDEPLSNLDAKLRNQMRTEIIKLRQKVNGTFVYVTHDQTEAMTLGDRIVIMKDGFDSRLELHKKCSIGPQTSLLLVYWYASDEFL